MTNIKLLKTIIVFKNYSLKTACGLEEVAEIVGDREVFFLGSKNQAKKRVCETINCGAVGRLTKVLFKYLSNQAK